MIASGVIAYLGPFTTQYRAKQIDSWVKLCTKMDVVCSQDFSLRDTLGVAVLIRSWNIYGLPSDAFSVENAIIVKYVKQHDFSSNTQASNIFYTFIFFQ